MIRYFMVQDAPKIRLAYQSTTKYLALTYPLGLSIHLYWNCVIPFRTKHNISELKKCIEK